MKTRFLKGILVLMLLVTAILLAISCSGVKLDNPEKVNYDGTTIRWSAVENAEKYAVQINDGDEYEVTGTSYPYNAGGQVFTVKVTAVSAAKKIVKSGTTQVTFQPLPQVGTISVADDGAISWDSVEGATGYVVKVVNAAGTQTTELTSAFYDGLSAGTNQVSVRAIVTGDSSYYSVFNKEINVKICDTVSQESIVYQDGLIQWNGVSDARFYRVSVNGSVLAEACAETQLKYDAQGKDFRVTVRAIGNHSTSYDGAASEERRFVYLANVTNIRVEDGILKWDAVGNADGYRLMLNGSVYRETLTDLSFAGLSAGVSTDIQIMPISSNATYFAQWSAQKTFKLLKAPVLQWASERAEETKQIYWNTVDGAAGYIIRLTHPDGKQEIKALSGDIVQFGDSFAQIGTYTVEAKSTASGDGNGCDSAYSLPITVTRLAAPKAAAENFITSTPDNLADGFTVNFGRVEGASGYVLGKDGSTSLAQGTKTSFTVTSVVDRDLFGEQTLNYTVRSLGSVRNVNGKIMVALDTRAEDALSFRITVLARPTDPTISGTVYSFGTVDKSNQYSVNVGGASYTANNNSFDLDSVLEAGTYVVRVCARGNGSDVLASSYSSPINVKRLAPPANIRINTMESGGTLMWDHSGDDDGSSAKIYIDNENLPRDADSINNMNALISVEGTTVYMVRVANRFSDDKQTYIMTSRRSQTKRFIKLKAPTFPEGGAFRDSTQLIWNAPSNVDAKVYTPTYVVEERNRAYNGEMNGTSMDISAMEAGSYQFTVRAIGDGENYVNSDASTVVAIKKLKSPEIRLENGQYVWGGVADASGYVVYVNGVVKKNVNHVSGSTYSYTPDFDEIGRYEVKFVAIGDGGKTTINSGVTLIMQETKQLTAPRCKLTYSSTVYDPHGELIVTVTTESRYATGYVYTIGGVISSDGDHESGTEYRRLANGTGTYTARVYAKGGAFDENGVFWINSQSESSNEVTLLGFSDPKDWTLSQDGVISWKPVVGALKYEVQVSVDGGEFITLETTAPSLELEDYDRAKSYTVKITAIGNGTTIITSEQKEKRW